MSDPTNAPQPTASATPSSPPATAAGTVPSSTPPEPWRAGESAPVWARGKTAEEIVNLGDQMFGILQQFNQQGRVAQPAGQPVTPAPVTPTDAGVEDDQYVSGRQLKSYMDQLAQTRFAPQMQQLAAQASQGVIGLVRREHADDFKRWGPEIEGLIAGLPAAERSLDNVERVVKYVRSEHLPELLADKERELRQQLQSEMVSPGLRSSGAPGAGPVPTSIEYSLASDKLPPQWKEQALRAGLTDQIIDEFCRGNNNMSRETFFKDYLMRDQVSTDKGVVRAS